MKTVEQAGGVDPQQRPDWESRDPALAPFIATWLHFDILLPGGQNRRVTRAEIVEIVIW